MQAIQARENCLQMMLFRKIEVEADVLDRERPECTKPPIIASVDLLELQPMTNTERKLIRHEPLHTKVGREDGGRFHL